MTLGSHSLSQQQLQALASGDDDPGAIRELTAAQFSKLLVLLRSVVSGASQAGGEQAAQARQAWHVLSAAHHHDPAAAEMAIRHPAVAAWATRTLQAVRGGESVPGAAPARLSGVAAAAAASAGLHAEITVPAVSGTLVLPSLGSAGVNASEAVVRTGPGCTEIVSSARAVQVPSDPHQDTPQWAGLRRLGPGDFRVLIDDVDPFRLPGSANVAPRLSGAEVADWQDVVAAAWRLLKTGHPADAREAAATINVIVPLLSPEQGMSSSSSAEAFGAIAMSRPPDPQMCAATIVHELQHLKLSAVIDITPLTHPDCGRRFYAAWRDDPRPASGLLQGVYAHLGLLRFWRQELRTPGGAIRSTAQREFARWLPATSQAATTLQSSPCLTPEGELFTAVMRTGLREMEDDPISGEAKALADASAQQHQRQWELRNGPIPV
jgi:uncharacterized protein